MKLISKVKKILWGAFGVSGLLVMAHCSESKKALETDGRSDQAKRASETDGRSDQAKIASETDGSRDQAKRA